MTENMAVGNVLSTVKVTVTPGFTPREPSIKPIVPNVRARNEWCNGQAGFIAKFAAHTVEL